VEQVISVDRPEWVPAFTGLSVWHFQKLVRSLLAVGVQPAPVGTVAAGSGAVGRGVLQVALLFGTSKSAAGRVVDHLAPLLVLPPHSTHPPAHAPTTTTAEPAALTTTPAYNETTAQSHCAENLAA
jgi:hypothetical protein